MIDYKQLIVENILDNDQLVEATFTGRMRGRELCWRKLVIRPVLLHQIPHLQFSYFDDTQNFTHNYSGVEAAAELQQALQLPFRNYHLHLVNESIQVNLTKKGKAIIGRSSTPRPRPRALHHDRQKQTILKENSPIPFLRAIGVTRADHRVKTAMRSKYNQINAFLQLLADIPEIDQLAEPLHMADLGCGHAYLTFAAYYYLQSILGKTVQLTGVDQQADLIQRNRQIAQELGWINLHFETGLIADFDPADSPDIVFALHACDTATDDALAQGIRHESQVILVAPCCHHELQVQLKDQPAPAGLAPIMRHGLWHERMGDILTDSFRALILRIMGYRVSVLEFVSPDHTPKNVLLRAIRQGRPGYRPGVQEFRQLQEAWPVTPYLQQLLAEELAPFLN